MEFLPTLIAALVVFNVVFLALRSVFSKKKGCSCGCENCSGCGSMPAKRK